MACQDDHISVVLFAVILQENIKKIFFILLPEQISAICDTFLVKLFKLFKLTCVPLKLLSGQLLIIILWDIS